VQSNFIPKILKVSIIVPVFNEAKTFSQMMGLLSEKNISSLEKEIIIVESNSTDGTREAVLEYKNKPEVKIILEDKPRGKGAAVRTGLLHATGDFILIQDGDLEYDLNDYDKLLAPLIKNEAAFVLGSRHVNGWKMRHFETAPWTSFIMNVGHVFFVTLLNILCGQKLKDPFTMYKVFRRDCLHGLTFKANRFDFDFELVIKLLRKGYVPLEIPINYKSRSFSEGKKVSIIRDPLTWIVALFRFRFEKLYQNSTKN
jgi:glycosyltransferase involved in cell wall biosynthesis